MDTFPSSNDRRGGKEQFPVDIKVTKGIRFETDLGDLMRIVVMSDCTTQLCLPYREYHYGNATISVEQVRALLMRSTKLEASGQAIEEFSNGMSVPLNIPQVVGFRRGIHKPMSASSRLFKAVDPDDSTKMIGLLIEQDAQGNLAQVTWYKTWEADAAFRSTPEQLAFEIVQDDQGAPSIDPNDIGGWAWHFSTNVGIGLSEQVPPLPTV